MRFALLAALALTAASARAQPPAVAAEVVAVRADTFVVRLKSGRRALLYSLVPTAAGYVLLSAGGALGGGRTSEFAASVGAALFFAGPSFGHFHARNDLAAVRGMALRGGAVAVGVTGAYLAFAGGFYDSDGGDSSLAPVGVGVMVAGGLLYVDSTAYDIATAPNSARRFNERERRRASVSLVPIVLPRRGAGAHLSVRF